MVLSEVLYQISVQFIINRARRLKKKTHQTLEIFDLSGFFTQF